MKIRKAMIMATSIGLLALTGVGSHAGAVVGGSTEVTQLLNLIELAASSIQLVRQTAIQFDQYSSMLKNLASTTPSALLNRQAQLLWNDAQMSQKFADLRTVVIDGRKQAYTLLNQDQLFKRLHSGYGTDFKSREEYQNWSDTSHQSVRNALAIAGAQAENFASEQDFVQELQARSSSADGQVKALQAGNDIAIAMIGQMQQLRQLQIAQMNAQNQYLAKETSMGDGKRTTLDVVFGHLKSSKVTPGTRVGIPRTVTP